jgi:hypothetical protein
MKGEAQSFVSANHSSRQIPELFGGDQSSISAAMRQYFAAQNGLGQVFVIIQQVAVDLAKR